MSKNITGPSHYRRGSIEVWDFIRDQDLNYHLGNAIKYICRAGFKDSKADDLRKAIHYLEDELQHTLDEQESERSSSGVSLRLLREEWFDEQADATPFDR